MTWIPTQIKRMKWTLPFTTLSNTQSVSTGSRKPGEEKMPDFYKRRRRWGIEKKERVEQINCVQTLSNKKRVIRREFPV